MDTMVHWNKLEINQTYYTKITGNTIGLDNPYTRIMIQQILHIPNDEAMIFTRLVDGTVRGYAVGGKFEDPLMYGPRNRFWTEVPTYIPDIHIHAACAA
jgi:hypothetical protein